MRRKILAYVIIGAILVLLPAAAWSKVVLGSTSKTDLPDCPTEDSINCYWDAKTQGNGQGRSFWTDADGNVHYLEEK
jgi:hypothetical protein